MRFFIFVRKKWYHCFLLLFGLKKKNDKKEFDRRKEVRYLFFLKKRYEKNMKGNKGKENKIY